MYSCFIERRKKAVVGRGKYAVGYVIRNGMQWKWWEPSWPDHIELHRLSRGAVFAALELFSSLSVLFAHPEAPLCK